MANKIDIEANATVAGVMAGFRLRRDSGPPRMLDDGRVRARLRTWPHQPGVAQVVLTDHTKSPSYTTLTDWLGVLRNWHYTRVRTGALAASATDAFVEHGFERVQTLALLKATVSRRTEFDSPVHELRSIRGPQQLSVAARIDAEAFENGWELDTTAIVDACHATPQHRIRLAVTSSDEPGGYIITGRNGSAGFIQRLAVRPNLQGQRIATSLLLDGLRWLQRKGVREVLVNTDFGNERALDLYRRFGFTLLPDSLQVFELALAEDTEDPELR
ncbi:MAG: GNAT family N-acetyltransferase [Ilumatobacteraceae bacterium]